MSTMQDYKSSLSDTASRKFETFSYLPEMDADQIRKQVEYIVSNGWNPAIEHTEPENAFGHYWYMWKLPMFGETDVDTVPGRGRGLPQGASRKPRPPRRLSTITPRSKGAEMVVYRGKPV